MKFFSNIILQRIISRLKKRPRIRWSAKIPVLNFLFHLRMTGYTITWSLTQSVPVCWEPARTGQTVKRPDRKSSQKADDLQLQAANRSKRKQGSIHGR